MTPKQRETVFRANHGICHICGLEIDTARFDWEADHVDAYELTGKSGKDHLEEYKPAHVKCHDDKTVADMVIIKKARSIRHKVLRVKKKKSGGFRGWRKMNGDVVIKRNGK